MAVAIAASCAFLTPIGHKNNTLIMGPGGYRFGDYWRMGLPLEIIVIAVSIPMILIVWPFCCLSARSKLAGPRFLGEFLFGSRLPGHAPRWVNRGTRVSPSCCPAYFRKRDSASC